MSTRRILVTGGSQGIGAAVVEQARAAGHRVAFTGRDRGRVDAVAAKTGAHGFVADVASGDDNARTPLTRGAHQLNERFRQVALFKQLVEHDWFTDGRGKRSNHVAFVSVVAQPSQWLGGMQLDCR